MPRTETTRASAPKPQPASPVEPIVPVETPEDPETEAKATHRLELSDPLPGHGLLLFEADNRVTHIVGALPPGEQAIVGQRLDGALRGILGDKGFALPPVDPAAGTPATRGRILRTLD